MNNPEVRAIRWAMLVNKLVEQTKTSEAYASLNRRPPLEELYPEAVEVAQILCDLYEFEVYKHRDAYPETVKRYEWLLKKYKVNLPRKTSRFPKLSDMLKGGERLSIYIERDMALLRLDYGI